MTRYDSTHLILNADDAISVSACSSSSASLSIFSQHHVAITFHVSHLPQLEQLVTLLWAAKDEEERLEQEAAMAQEKEDQSAIALERVA
jgi:phosphohistidine phosphatase SixA